MSTLSMIVREMVHRGRASLLAFACVALAVTALTTAGALLDAHDARTREILDSKRTDVRVRMIRLDENIRRAMNALGFNVVILPAEQSLGDWYSADYSSKLMPAEYVDRLAKANVITVERIVPQLRRRVKWTETEWTVILAAVGGDAPVAGFPAEESFGLVRAPRGSVSLGHEVHAGLRLKAGDMIDFLGRRLAVRKCVEERGTQDDITVWMNLQEAQELLGLEGRISEILALECRSSLARPAAVRAEISQVLPDVQVVERKSETLAMVDARTGAAREAAAAIELEREHRKALRIERGRLAAVIVGIVMSVSVVWMGLLFMANARARRAEIGILRAIGFKSRHILLLFLGKALAIGMAGGVAGFATASAAGARGAGMFLASLAVAVGICVAASFVPAMLAAREDPAAVLQQE